MTRLRTYSFKVNEDFMNRVLNISGESITDTILMALEEFDMSHRPREIELLDRKKEIEKELEGIRTELKVIEEGKRQKKPVGESKSETEEEYNLKLVQNSIKRQLINLSINQLLHTKYFSVYKKQLNINDDKKLIDLIVSCANEKRIEEWSKCNTV